jgi:hypothetical protein
MRVNSSVGILFYVSILFLFHSVCISQVDFNSTDWGVHQMEYSRVGTAGWQFLKLHTTPRSMAMGGVRSVLGYGDAGTALTNPASMSDVENFDGQIISMKWVADIQYNAASLVKNMSEWGCFGLNIVHLNYGDMVKTEIGEFNGVPGMLAVTEGLGTFSAYDLALGLSYSRKITNQLQIGGNIRYIEEKIADAKMNTWGLDIGTIYWTGLGSLRVSMLGKNFGPDGEFTVFANRLAQAPARIRLPMMFILGAGYDILQFSNESPQRLTIVAEYIKPNDGLEKVNLGTEYFFYHYFYLRAGYRFNYDEESYSFGFGGEYTIEENMRIKVDYAYADLGRFNYANMFSIGFGF